MEKNTAKTFGWNFDNSYTRLPESFYSIMNPSPVRSPGLIIMNTRLAEDLGLIAEALQSPEGVAILAGNRVTEGSKPLAQAYAGHQFGHFTMLGDGRAHLLGEQITPQGERFDIQLKGSGRTTYSRRGDGRASLGPMLREYIISEAMYALGIPTTRSLAVITTGEPVIRETPEPGAILTRVASSHLRVGTFEYISQWGTIEDLRTLADYTLQRHFSDIPENRNRYLFLLEEVIKRQVELIAKWQLVGFIHGVMNTDNMALSGETIDYGPCAFMNVYDPETVFSSIDTYGRYAYGNQPRIGVWNLAKFAGTLLPLLHEDEEEALQMGQDAVSDFGNQYYHKWLSGMRSKLGLYNEEPEDNSLVEQLLGIMKKEGADFTNTFRSLTSDKPEKDLIDNQDFVLWHVQWQERLGRQQEKKSAVQELMRRSNPAIIPRNHQVEKALETAVKQNDYTVLERLVDVLSRPFAYSTEQDDYVAPPPPSACNYRTFCGT